MRREISKSIIAKSLFIKPLPEELVTAIQRQSSIAHDIWKKAKASNDWELFRPELEKNVDLAKRSAEILMKAKKVATPYDALIDLYEPGITVEVIDRLFVDLAKGVARLLEQINNSPFQPDRELLHRHIPTNLQRIIAVFLAETLQYDVTSASSTGRIDETEHPFTSGYFGDVRITTHYHENLFTSSIFSILHEVGHALYEQNLNPSWIYQPVGSACSTGIHESQSRMVENMIGRSREFWTPLFPRLKEITGGLISDIDFDSYIGAINLVEPSKIRIEADEITYNLHVIIRFNLEKELFNGNLTVKDLPQLWSQAYQDYLGVQIENDTEGILQDMHWAEGSFGYFPCYALGNIYAGQFLKKMDTDFPFWRVKLEEGDFTPVKEWLVGNIHRTGNLYDPLELVRTVTGSELSAEPFLDYLTARYSALYRL